MGKVCGEKKSAIRKKIFRKIIVFYLCNRHKKTTDKFKYFFYFCELIEIHLKLILKDMKTCFTKFFILVFLLAGGLMLNLPAVVAQDASQESSKEETVQPIYPGGPLQASVFIGKNFKYPKDAKEIKGVVVVEFFVEEDGALTEIKIAESLLKSIDEEVVRVVKMMPKWTPGKENGKVVRMNHKMPIHFVPQESVKVEDRCDGKYIKVEKE